MVDLTPLNKIKEELHQALNKTGEFEKCALVDCPPGKNIGSILLWISSALCLTDILKIKIKYTSSESGFSENEMKEKIGQAPIFLRGGLVGDFLRPDSANRHHFYEYIVSRYKERPVFILPQSFFFVDENKLRRLAQTFNAHPRLTIFVRENYSYQLAQERFPRCRLIFSPDTVFHLADMPQLILPVKRKTAPLYLKRTDDQDAQYSPPASLDVPELMVEDWRPYHWLTAKTNKINIPGLNRLVREFWQRGLAAPQEWSSRQNWKRSSPFYLKLKKICHEAGFKPAWPDGIVHSAFYQLRQHPLIITNRLHGHVISCLLGIPNIALPGPGGPTLESLYNSWTHRIPYCRYVKEAKEVKSAAEELLELYSYPAS